MRVTLARWLVVGSLAGIGLFFGSRVASAQEAPAPTPTPAAATAEQAPAAGQSDSAVQGSNSATDAAATTADADASNDATVSAGPSAAGGQSSQIGDNDIRVTQRSSAKTGDAVAGAQVIGVVGGSAVIQAQNSSVDAVAESGEATAENVLEIGAGPSGGSAQQFGDNRVRVDQESFAESGSAIAGAQVTGLVNADAVVQNSSFSDGAEAISGDAEAVNELDLEAGPAAAGLDGASASQIGDNDAVFTQSSEALSGDAVAGGQVTGAVGDDALVQNQNSSTDPEAESGEALAENVAEAVAAPRAGPEDTAQVSQFGDNELDADQDVRAHSGDAIAGGQVTGLVSEERGHLAVQNQQSSEDPEAISGDAEAVNDLEVIAGADAFSDGDIAQAGQFGDNDVNVTQLTEAVSGDALAGAQVFGGVGGEGIVQGSNASFGAEATSGDAVAEGIAEVEAGAVAFNEDGDAAQVSQFGDNELDLDQRTVAETGDAVAGGQVAGLVGRGDPAIQLQNASEDSVAESGEAEAINEALVDSGPVADAGDGVASASQSGDNDLRLSQDVAAVTGDAVAGGQVVGAVGVDETLIQGSNFSDGDEALSADAEADNSAEGSLGPTALGDEFGSVSQSGDNDFSLDQVIEAVTGDGIAGGQIFGQAA